MKSNKYCDSQDLCKLLIAANNQYNKVVKQNKSLQGELKNAKEELDNLVTFFTEDEISMINRLLRYNRAINAIKEIVSVEPKQYDGRLIRDVFTETFGQILKEIERIGE